MLQGNIPGIPANVGAFVRQGQPGETIEVIVKFAGDIARVAAAAGGMAELLSDNYAILTIPIGQLIPLYSYPEVEYVELPRTLTFVLSRSLSHACITYVQSDFGFALRGNGILIGMIDSGIDYTHPDFRNPDGTTRIAFLWDQSINGAPPEGFLYGTEYTAAEINAALQADDPFSVVPSRDNLGHGTAVAGIAAGNGRASQGVQVGAAPQATLAVVKLGDIDERATARSTQIMRAIKYLYDKAEQLNMPLAINLSYGTNFGAHDGTSLFEGYISDMAERGRSVISVATGNEGSAGHHFSGRVLEDGQVTVEFTTSGQINEIFMPVWKNFVDSFSYELISPSGRTTGEILPIQSAVNVVLDNVQVNFYFGQPTHYQLAQENYFMFRGAGGRPIPQGVWTLIIRGLDVVDGNFDIWLPTGDAVSSETAFLQPDTSVTLTIPSTVQNVISVGGYNSLIGNSADFSGRGNTRFIVYPKPDIVAPAVAITTARAGGGYDTFTGTSMAAPFVTGAAALMMEWGLLQGNDPFLYGQRVKAFLQKGARRELAIAFPNTIWGYGTLCLNNTMNLLVEYLQRGGPPA
ncbi:MAG TPA: S8 family peptidase [Feifaniaceae bacterium]|nr:S8 family peptidase [Feifaniaceae bacterium]